MEQTTSIYHMLDLMQKPAFCVGKGVILHVNQAARQRQIAKGCDIFTLLPADADAYREYNGGCLYLTVNILGITSGASISRTSGIDIFVLDDESETAQLEAYSLAAKQLRIPLSNLMAAMDLLFYRQSESDETIRGQVNRELHQLHRIVNNMADSAYVGKDESLKEILDISAVFDEILEKAATHLSKAKIKLVFTGLGTAVYGSISRQLLERALYNLISNAAKFSSKTSFLEASLTSNGSMLYFRIWNRAQDVALQGNVFNRFLREPGIEDSRYGIGLGMALIRSAATAHGGTVLIDQPEADCVRVTMTLTIRHTDAHEVRSPVLHISDYAGGRDHALLELCDILPASAYEESL